MSDFRFRAYISYSHKDEKWATWLHRAIESYRVPGKLVGQKTTVGKVPSRVRPIFRDRDDLSSGSDLQATVKQALIDSESLIVVCSPEAAASRWVNAEVTEFARLGRSDRIFCIIVSGDPAADGSISACLPEALTKAGIKEPLAADIRKWADGKQLAKLKVIAGMLGIHLDALRQRQIQRQRKRRAILGLGAAAALTLALITVYSQISERHQREKAEQLATFVVDLGERLKTDADLETLALISAEASRHLQSLDPEKLSPETGKKVALAIRQMASVDQFQGKPERALSEFSRSRDLLMQLHLVHPQDQGLLFELGNAEYYVGNLHYTQGRHKDALTYMQNYHRLTQQLSSLDPENMDWVLEVSYSHNNLAAVQLDSGMGIDDETMVHVAEATKLMETVVKERPEDEMVASVYATTLAWAADAQYQACNLKEAIGIRNEVLELSEFSLSVDPGNNDLKKQYAFALTGVARLQLSTGELESARENLESAVSILQQLSLEDRSNLHYREELLYRRVMLSRLIGDMGELDMSRSMMEALKVEFEKDGELLGKSAELQKEYTSLLLAYADLEIRMGNSSAAKSHLQNISKLFSDNPDRISLDLFDTNRLILSQYMWWQLNDVSKFDDGLLPPENMKSVSSRYKGCTDADSAARRFFIEGAIDDSKREVAYLRGKGYAEPAFMRFCRQNNLCRS